MVLWRGAASVVVVWRASLPLESQLGQSTGRGGCLCTGSLDLCRPGQFHDLRPCLGCGEVWHVVVVNPFVEFVTFLLEHRTAAIPTGMTCCLAGNAPGVVSVCAGHGAMLQRTGTTDVLGCPTVDRHVAPPVALQAPEWLPLALFGIDLLMTEEEAVGQSVVGRLGRPEGEDKVAAGLRGFVPRWGLDPPCPGYVAHVDAVRFLDLMEVCVSVWVES